MNAIGGYFSLELNRGKEYHSEAIRLNTGRAALEYILRSNNYKKIYLPFYTCDVLLEPVIKLGLEYEFYSINEDFEPVFDFNKIKQQQTFLYTNYFGLKDQYICSLNKRSRNLIIDNAQAFFAKPLENLDTFYSARKFFGVSDGAYAYSKAKIPYNLEKDVSYKRFEHLVRRIDESAEDAYPYFIENDESLNNMPILRMSDLTRRILESIDYSAVAAKRKENFNYLHQALKPINAIHFNLNDVQVPMIYPFYSDDLSIRKKLIENKIYTAVYWPNVSNWVDENSVEYKYSTRLIHLPIDQRLDKKELNKILKIIVYEYKR